MLSAAFLACTLMVAGLPPFSGFLAKFAEKRTVPYGIALAAAALTVYPKSIWVQSII